MHEISDETLALIGPVRAALEKRTVECPDCEAISHIDSATWAAMEGRVTDRCKGTGRVPDPQAAAFLEVLKVPCKGNYSTSSWTVLLRPTHGGPSDSPYIVICSCYGTGYVDYPWEGLPQGAMAGAIGRVAKELRLDYLVDRCRDFNDTQALQYLLGEVVEESLKPAVLDTDYPEPS